MKRRFQVFTMLLLVGILVLTPLTAYASLNFHHNWTSDNGLGPANGQTNGPDGRTVFRSNLATGNFSAEWQTTRMNSNFNNLHGLGWRVGRHDRIIGYNVGYLRHTSGLRGMTIAAFYGWTRQPLIEYYVLEHWLNHRSTPGTLLGTLTSDGATYEIWREYRNSHNIDGMGPFIQIKSVRTTPAPLGQNHRITFQNHVNAWGRVGQPMGREWYYQAFIIEGWESDGSGNATVWGLN